MLKTRRRLSVFLVMLRLIADLAGWFNGST
jgi:hypothetical protein